MSPLPSRLPARRTAPLAARLGARTTVCFAACAAACLGACAAVCLAACAPGGRPPPSPPPPPGPEAPPTGLEFGSPAELVAPGVASSEFGEVRLAASPDGSTLLWGSTDRPGGRGGWDIWLARREGEGFGRPEPAPFNSEANDFDPAYSPDGRFVYFFSKRPGGLGGDDIYRVAALPGGGFGAVEHLGAEVNSPGDEWAPALSPDGRALLFASDGRGGRGRHDLFVAAARGDGWARAEPLPGALNTPDDEFDATFLGDGTSIVFARSPDAGEKPATLHFAARGPAGYGPGSPLDAAVNVAGGWNLGPALDWRDRSLLYFTSRRPEASAGKLDLYRIRYRLR
jgi:TolB protein